jgi:hypothetical protein
MTQEQVVEGKKDKTTGCERLLEFSTGFFTAVENTNPLSNGIPLLPHRLKIGGYRFADRRKARSIQLNNARESNTGFLHISRKKVKKVLR